LRLGRWEGSRNRVGLPSIIHESDRERTDGRVAKSGFQKRKVGGDGKEEIAGKGKTLESRKHN